MPGHLGRMRPIKRHRSHDSDKLEFPVVMNGRAGPADSQTFQNTTRESDKPFGSDYTPHDNFTQQEKPSSEDSSSQEVHLNQAGPSNDVSRPTDAEILAAKQENLRWELAHVDEDPVDHSKVDYRGWADKGKELLFGKKKKALR